jgi:hypothetical protein
MAQCGFSKAAVYTRRCRERRVHQHDARPDLRIEPVVDLLGIVARHCYVAEQSAEKGGAGVGDFVQRKTRFGKFGENRQQPRAGRRLQNQVGRGDRGGFGGGETERDRRRKLLQAFGFLRPARLRRQPRAEPRQHLGHGGGRAGAGAHGAAEFAQEEDLRGLTRLVASFHTQAPSASDAQNAVSMAERSARLSRARPCPSNCASRVAA